MKSNIQSTIKNNPNPRTSSLGSPNRGKNNCNSNKKTKQIYQNLFKITHVVVVQPTFLECIILHTLHIIMQWYVSTVSVWCSAFLTNSVLFPSQDKHLHQVALLIMWVKYVRIYFDWIMHFIQIYLQKTIVGQFQKKKSCFIGFIIHMPVWRFNPFLIKCWNISRNLFPCFQLMI